MYLQVLLVIDVGAYVSDVVAPLLLDDLKIPELPLFSRLLRWACTAVAATAWSVARFAKPGRSMLIALESGVTLVLVLAYIHVALADAGGALSSYVPVFALFGVVLLLVVRASLVPSPVSRTVVIGVSSVVCVFVFVKEALGALNPGVTDGLEHRGRADVVA